MPPAIAIEVAGHRARTFVRQLGATAFADRGPYGATIASLFDAPDVWTLVARHQRPLGFCMVRVRGLDASLPAVAVAAGQRGLGLGRRLVEAAIALARHKGARELTLAVAEGAPAAGFFAALGFRPHGDAGRYPNGHHAHLLHRSIPVLETP